MAVRDSPAVINLQAICQDGSQPLSRQVAGCSRQDLSGSHTLGSTVQDDNESRCCGRDRNPSKKKQNRLCVMALHPPPSPSRRSLNQDPILTFLDSDLDLSELEVMINVPKCLEKALPTRAHATFFWYPPCVPLVHLHPLHTDD